MLTSFRLHVSCGPTKYRDELAGLEYCDSGSPPSQDTRDLGGYTDGRHKDLGHESGPWTEPPDLPSGHKEVQYACRFVRTILTR